MGGIQKPNITINDSMINEHSMETVMSDELNCSTCVNDLCFGEADYQAYEEWISVNNFETVLIILHCIQILTGILGNFLVSKYSIMNILRMIIYVSTDIEFIVQIYPITIFLNSLFIFMAQIPNKMVIKFRIYSTFKQS